MLQMYHLMLKSPLRMAEFHPNMSGILNIKLYIWT
jgi:hypothetical protein